jgi:hypothetical protein
MVWWGEPLSSVSLPRTIFAEDGTGRKQEQEHEFTPPEIAFLLPLSG